MLLYRIWLFLCLVLVVNLVGAILLLISGATNGIAGSSRSCALVSDPC